MYTIENILDSLISEYSQKISENDINSIALFIIGYQLLKIKNDLDKAKMKLSESVKEIIFQEAIKNKIEKIYEAIEMCFSKKKIL